MLLICPRTTGAGLPSPDTSTAPPVTGRVRPASFRAVMARSMYGLWPILLVTPLRFGARFVAHATWGGRPQHATSVAISFTGRVAAIFPAPPITGRRFSLLPRPALVSTVRSVNGEKAEPVPSA
jgi:hypothetical protein